MLMLISYDVKTTSEDGARRLRRISQACLDYGIRVQFSVFECEITPAQWVELKARLLATYNPEHDSLRFYHLGSTGLNRKIEHFGTKSVPDLLRDPLVL